MPTRRAPEPSPAPVLATGKAAAIEAPGQLASHYAPTKPLRLNAERAQPGEWLIGAIRATGLRGTPTRMTQTMLGLGEPLWQPPAPKGFDDVSGPWMDGLPQRLEVANQFVRRGAAAADPKEALETGDWLSPPWNGPFSVPMPAATTSCKPACVLAATLVSNWSVAR